jgi:hypothetical protein
LQFNIGKEDEDGRRWRYGVAFDFAPSQTLPDPVATLSPKVDRFNEWLRSNRRKLRHFEMWHSDGDDWSFVYRPREIPGDLLKRDTFVFLGTTFRRRYLDIDQILEDFDSLFPLYEYVESMVRKVRRSPTMSAGEAGAEQAPDGTPYRPQGGDERELIDQQIRARRGQQQFRNALRQRYGDQCVITGCEVLALLEAAHIKPYRGVDDNNAENGLLLRADIHTLFDLYLLGIEPDGLGINLAPAIANDSVYGKLAGKALLCASDRRPSHPALELRYKEFQERTQRSRN